jgi:hypothetical protein
MKCFMTSITTMLTRTQQKEQEDIARILLDMASSQPLTGPISEEATRRTVLETHGITINKKNGYEDYSYKQNGRKSTTGFRWCDKAHEMTIRTEWVRHPINLKRLEPIQVSIYPGSSKKRIVQLRDNESVKVFIALLKESPNWDHS